MITQETACIIETLARAANSLELVTNAGNEQRLLLDAIKEAASPAKEKSNG